MINRRSFILAAVSMLSMPYPMLAAIQKRSSLSWGEFLDGMQALSNLHKNQSMNLDDISEHGLKIMQQLNVNSDAFNKAINQSYESGSQFWLWQRLVKEHGLNGGILHVEKKQAIPLHDHPHSVGILRMLSGEAEVWQFDKLTTQEEPNGNQQATLQLLSHKLLKPGDTAILTPARGNIHAVKARSRECSMLDFFIPPYNRNERSWYIPRRGELSDKRLVCSQIPDHEFSLS